MKEGWVTKHEAKKKGVHIRKEMKKSVESKERKWERNSVRSRCS